MIEANTFKNFNYFSFGNTKRKPQNNGQIFVNNITKDNRY